MDKRIAAQLYTVSDFTHTKEDFEETIKKILNIGYKAVQISGVGDILPEDMHDICKKYNLAVICTHKSYDDYTQKLDEMIDFHKNSGAILRDWGILTHRQKPSKTLSRIWKN